MLALKALVAGTGKPLGSETPRRIVITLDGAVVHELVIAANEADVMRQVDLSDQLARGTHHLSLDGRAGRNSAYQVVFRYHEPDAAGRLAPASSSSAVL